MLKIKEDILISEEELDFRFSRSSGPGGQNVNKVNTRVTVLFNVPDCVHLSESQKRRILARLSTRTNKQGVLRVISQRHRTRNANRRAAIGRLEELLNQALTRKAVRKKTRVPYRERERRLEEKKQRSRLKKLRSKNLHRIDF